MLQLQNLIIFSHSFIQSAFEHFCVNKLTKLEQQMDTLIQEFKRLNAGPQMAAGLGKTLESVGFDVNKLPLKNSDGLAELNLFLESPEKLVCLVASSY